MEPDNVEHNEIYDVDDDSIDEVVDDDLTDDDSDDSLTDDEGVEFISVKQQQLNKRKYYLTKQMLMDAYRESLELDRCSDNLLSYFEKIARRFSTKYRNNIQNKTDWNAIVNFAVSEAWMKWKSYDPKRTDNIFSFYTTMIANDMRAHYKLLNKGKSINISIESLFAGSKD